LCGLRWYLGRKCCRYRDAERGESASLRETAHPFPYERVGPNLFLHADFATIEG
jgi:hypothetical protein